MLTGDDRGAAEYTGIGASRLPLILLAAVFGGMVLVVMALVVSATISLSVRQRQQELALLRASGATPAQAHRMVVVETTAVALLGAVFGVPAGALAGDLIFSASTAQGVFPAQLVFHQGIVPFAGGFLLAVGLPWLTAHFAARSAAKARPIQALTEAAIPTANLGPVRKALGKAFAAATVALAATTMFLDPETASAIGGPAVLTGSIAVGLFGPELVHVVAGMAAPVLRRFSGGALAAINIGARARQFAAVLTPLTLATAIALGNIYAQTTQSDAAAAARADELSADVVVSSADRVVPADLADRLRGAPGVTTASSLVTSKGWIEEPYDGNGSDPSTVLGVDAQTADPVLSTPVAEGSLRDLAGASVALPQAEAENLGVRLGGRSPSASATVRESKSRWWLCWTARRTTRAWWCPRRCWHHTRVPACQAKSSSAAPVTWRLGYARSPGRGRSSATATRWPPSSPRASTCKRGSATSSPCSRSPTRRSRRSTRSGWQCCRGGGNWRCNGSPGPPGGRCRACCSWKAPRSACSRWHSAR